MIAQTWRLHGVSFVACVLAAALLQGCKDSDPLDQLGYGDLRAHEAARAGDLETLEELLKSGVNLEDTDWESNTPLTAAAAAGQNEAIKLLLDHGAGVNDLDALSQTPLMAAAKHGHLETMELLISRGASLDPVNGRTPLHSVAFGPVERIQQRIAVAEFLINAGISPNDDGGENHIGITPFLRAAHRCDIEMLKFLESRGAKATTTSTGDTTIHFAVSRPRPVADFRATIEYLVELGVPIDAVNDDNESALLIAVLRTDVSQVRTLLECGADPNVCSVLHYALFDLDLTKLLVEHGADPSAPDEQGRTALEMANHSEAQEVAAYLRSLQ